jgi:hypothetical protein
MTALQGLGAQMSQPGSMSTVTEIKDLMSNINGLVNADTSVSSLSSGTTTMTSLANTMNSAVSSVSTGFVGLP